MRLDDPDIRLNDWAQNHIKSWEKKTTGWYEFCGEDSEQFALFAYTQGDTILQELISRPFGQRLMRVLVTIDGALVSESATSERMALGLTNDATCHAA